MPYLELPSWYPQIDAARHIWSVVRATLSAPRLVEDRAERAHLVRAWLDQYVLTESAILADEGHPSAGLMAQIATSGSAGSPLDRSALEQRLRAVARDVRFAAHTAAYLLIAAEVDPTKADHKHALESWNRLQTSVGGSNAAGAATLEPGTARSIRSRSGSIGPLALAERGVQIARAHEDRGNKRDRALAHLDVLVLTDHIVRRLEQIRLHNGERLFKPGYFWIPGAEWVKAGRRPVRVTQPAKFTDGLLRNVLDGMADPVVALCRMGVQIR